MPANMISRTASNYSCSKYNCPKCWPLCFSEVPAISLVRNAGKSIFRNAINIKCSEMLPAETILNIISEMSAFINFRNNSNNTFMGCSQYKKKGTCSFPKC